jgi:hypothetical protein
MKHTLLIRIGMVAFLLIGSTVLWNLMTFSHTPKESDVEHNRQFTDSYRIFSLTLPSEMEFCGEKVPMDMLHVRESLDRELLVNTYWQSNSILYHKRAGRWFPMIEKILEENEVPADMKYIALIESGLTNVVSPAGATGYWQFMKGTGKEYGLEISGEVDERYHVRKATEAACKYLKLAHTEFGSWTMAAASYNIGMNGLRNQVNRQKADGYYELLLVEETSRYVFRALALKEILKNPERYGFHIREKDRYKPFKTTTIMIDGPVESFANLAKSHGTNYRVLKMLNPWLRESFLTNPRGNSYTILLPAEGFNDAPKE